MPSAHGVPLGGVVDAPPVPRFIVSRPRVSAALDRASAHRLVLVRGPAGSGKTLAVAEWARQPGRTGVWVTFRPSPSELDLWQRAARAIGAAVGETTRPAQTRALVARHLEDKGGTVIVDGLDAQPDAAVEILWLLRETSRVRFVVLSQRRTGLETPAVFTEFDACVLPTAEFAFDVDETSAALARRGLSFDQDVPALVRSAFAGWPAATGFACAHLSMNEPRVWRAPDVARILLTVERELADRVLGALRGHPDRESIEATALLPYLSAATVTGLCGEQVDAGALMTALEELGFGSRARVHGEDRFRFTDHIRRTLTTAVTARDDDGVHELIRRAATASEAAGEPFAAVELSRRIGDWDAVCRVTEQWLPIMLARHASGLRELVDALPRDPEPASPLLLLVRALLMAADPAGRADAASAAFSATEASARDTATGATGIDALRLATIRLVAHRSRGSFARASELGDRLVSQVTAVRRELGRAADRDGAEALSQAAKTAFQLDRFETAVERFEEAAHSGNAHGHLRIDVAGHLALIHALTGDVVEARSLLADCATDPDWQTWRHTAWAVAAHIAEALVAIECFDHQAARRRLATLDRLRLRHELDPLIVAVRALLQLTTGDGYGGLATLRDFERPPHAVSASNHMLGLIAGVKADLLLATKQIGPALEALRPYLDGRERTMGPYARALLFAGREQQLMVFAERCFWRDALSPRARMEVSVAKAIAARRSGDGEAAARAVEVAEAVGAAHGLSLAWALAPQSEVAALLGPGHPVLNRLRDAGRPVFGAELTVPALTKRESVVLRQLQSSASFEQIARTLCVSPHTVKSQARSVYRKLGASSRAEAVRAGLEWRLI